MLKILVISDNNACRSAMAEGWLSYYGRSAAQVVSAGIKPTNLDLRAAQSMMDAVIDITHHKPKKLDNLLSERFDIVIILDNKLSYLKEKFSKSSRFFIYHFSPPVIDGNDDNATRLAYDSLRDEIENWAFDFVHENIKKLM